MFDIEELLAELDVFVHHALAGIHAYQIPLFAFVWETSVPNMPGDMYRLTISSYLTSIAQRPSPRTGGGLMDALGGMLGVNTIPVDTAWACLIGLTVVCLGAGSYWFSHFEYMAREDAE